MAVCFFLLLFYEPRRHNGTKGAQRNYSGTAILHDDPSESIVAPIDFKNLHNLPLCASSCLRDFVVQKNIQLLKSLEQNPKPLTPNPIHPAHTGTPNAPCYYPPYFSSCVIPGSRSNSCRCTKTIHP
ncbi:hypothetical protein SAMN05444008_109154 [Cnuella takakiae]|uniref:Uncharacterized protein n=1 Tax=Cnuella takakiae TaxID=1302690 RepID=A0A1M5CP41_9BACT|nr:hypothetical protein SAMN05444008_109154 [Cnuella takakiae]